MVVLGLDAAPTVAHGVLYDAQAARVVSVHPSMSLADVRALLRPPACPVRLVAIERVQGQGRTVGASVITTSEMVGRLLEIAEARCYRTIGLYRREVLAHLDALGRGNRDALVKARLCEWHGCASIAEAKGTRKAPGPLRGLANDLWAACAVAIVGANVAVTRGAA